MLKKMLDADIDGRKRTGELKKAAALTAVMLLISSVFNVILPAFGTPSESVFAKEKSEADIEEKIGDSISGLFGDSKDEEGLTKNETTYVIMDADGKSKDVIVEEWLKNTDSLDEIEDESTLKEIENVSGDERYERRGNELIWEASGNDIKYRGSTDNELPVDVKLSYYLDGKRVKAEEIAGSSGKVEIHFDYDVRARDTIGAKGGTYELFHPYLMVSGLILPKESFDDVKINAGRTMTEGDNVICIGIAMPGLKQNLGLENDSIDIPEKVVIEADAEKFSLDGTYTVAVQGMPVDLGQGNSIGDDISSVESSFDMLQEASSKLVSGTSELYKGTAALGEGAGALEIGSDKLRAGSKALDKGAGKLYKGASALAKGSSKLFDGTTELRKKSEELSKGVTELSDGATKLAKGSSSLKEGSRNALKGSGDLSDGLSKLDSNSAALMQGTEEVVKAVFQGSTSTLQQMLVVGGMPLDQAKKYVLEEGSYADTLSALSVAIPAYKEEFDAVRSELDKVVYYKESVRSYTAGVGQARSGSELLSEGLGKLDSGIDSIDKGIEQVGGGLSKLSGSMPELKKGIKALDSGAGELNKGIKALKKGGKTLSDGTGKLYKGTSDLEDGADKLAGGTSTLSKGAGVLKNGMKKFDRDGIHKLVTAFDLDKISDISSRMSAISEASSREYYMGGTKAGLSGENKLIFRTGAVK